MSIRMFLATLAAAAIIIGAALPARACEFDARDIQDDIDKVDVIFTGSVTLVQHLGNDRNLDGPEYKAMFEADKIYKGRLTPDAQVKVTQRHDTWARYFHFSTGKKYLVLANRSQFGLVVDACSVVIALDPAAARKGEPGPEYREALAAALGDLSLFPAQAPAPQNGARRRLELENKQDSGNGGY